MHMGACVYVSIYLSVGKLKQKVSLVFDSLTLSTP